MQRPICRAALLAVTDPDATARHGNQYRPCKRSSVLMQQFIERLCLLVHCQFDDANDWSMRQMTDKGKLPEVFVRRNEDAVLS